LKPEQKKVDLRFNNVKEAILEIRDTLHRCPLNNEALAVLISNASKGGISKTQVLAVIDHMSKLERHYLK
jgi:hypothetical protein